MPNEAPHVVGEYLHVRYAVLNLSSQRVETSTRLDHPEDVFVLNPLKDRAAMKALRVYADECYPELGDEIHKWLNNVDAERELLRGMGVGTDGDVGTLNMWKKLAEGTDAPA